VIKYLLAGADVVMTTSALLRHGVGHLKMLISGLTDWMKLHNFSVLTDMRGMLSQRALKDPIVYERANYINILQGWPLQP
jgi:dihydroorotate dehydrogenase (fumarate)